MSGIEDLFDTAEETTQSQDQREGRFYGILDGVVTEVETSSPALGRIKARFGVMTNQEQSDWLDPVWPGGMECLPNKDDPVWVMFVDGDPNRGIWAWHPTTKTTGRATEAAVL